MAQSRSAAAAGAGVDHLMTRNAVEAAAGVQLQSRNATTTESTQSSTEDQDQNDQDQQDQAAEDEPTGPLPITYSQSTGIAECLGADCATLGESVSTTTGLGDAAVSTSTGEGRCTGLASGCAVFADATAATTPDAGMSTDPQDPAAEPVPGVAGTTQAGARIDCPAQCRGTVTGDTVAAASPDGGATAAIATARDALQAAQAAQAAGSGGPVVDGSSVGTGAAAPAGGPVIATGPAEPALNGAGVDPTSVSVAGAESACGGDAPCTAAVRTNGSASTSGPVGAERFATTGAGADAVCTTALGGCPAATTSFTVGTDDPAAVETAVWTAHAAQQPITPPAADPAADQATDPTADADDAPDVQADLAALPRTTLAIAGSGCASTEGCHSGTTGFTADHTAEVAAECLGIGCTTRTQGAALYDGNTATADTACTSAEFGQCAGTSRVGATATGADVSATCAGTEGSTCTHEYAAASHAADTTGGHRATADATCGAAGAAGAGWCGTSALAATTADTATAAAACQGSAGSGCRYSYRAHSAERDSAAGSAARASATGTGSGTLGGGQAVTTATADAGPGQASASASCQGTPGTDCGYSYSARAAASASAPGASARASASGSGGGGMGSGGVAVSAQASAAPGRASASASCSGAANCRHSYSASASASASAPGASARASASGSGGGGQGSGGVGVSAQASAAPGRAMASASCSGAANCRHSYSASASASASDPSGSYANAAASGSGGGGQGSGGVAVSAQAQAGDGFARASASCSGAANCSATYTAHAELTRTSPAGETAHGEGTCSGTGNGGCGVTARVRFGPNGGGGAECFGNCANFSQNGWYRAPAGTGYDSAGNLVPVDRNGNPVPIEELGPEDRAVQGTRDADGNPILKIKPRGGDVRTYPCPQIPCTANGPGGERITYDPDRGGFDAGMPVQAEAPQGPMDTATGTDGVRIARDRRGNGSGWIRGTGQVSNGSTGETVTYTEPAPSGDQHGFRLTNPTTGSPFTAHCGAACEYRGAPVPGAPQVDHLVLRSGTADIVGRDRNGTPAMISFDGTGRFTSAEGDLLTGIGPVTSPGIATGRVNIVTRDRAGLGGSIALQGEGSIRPVEGGGLICTGGACAGTHHMPTERGAGGVNVCSLTAAGSCTGIGAPVGSGRTTAADLQLASVPAGQGGSVYFVQYLRNTDGTGGGA
ncbi:MAG TPA: hypothetical protein VEZ42_15210, partial [Pseudonocardia sp.]|nr:hypothetical protein [Pseudonocardia sp.]